MAARFVGYLRVSTARQGQSGLGLEAQRQAVAEHVNGHGVLLAEYVEVESGKRNDRPELARALAHCRTTGATLIVGKLDRLSRNAAFLIGLRDAGVEIVACDLPQANRLLIGIMALVAEQEREAISQRTRAALQAAKARGQRLGNPNGAAALHGLGNAPAVAAVKAGADRHAQQVLPVIEGLRGEGITSLKGLASELNRRGVLAPRGGQWSATSVRRLLARSP